MESHIYSSDRSEMAHNVAFWTIPTQPIIDFWSTQDVDKVRSGLLAYLCQFFGYLFAFLLVDRRKAILQSIRGSGSGSQNEVDISDSDDMTRDEAKQLLENDGLAGNMSIELHKSET